VKSGEELDAARQMAAHESTRLYDRRREEISLD
jgi:hypothetical protein